MTDPLVQNQNTLKMTVFPDSNEMPRSMNYMQELGHSQVSYILKGSFEPHISTGLTLWYRELIALSQVEIHVSKPAHVE